MDDAQTDAPADAQTLVEDIGSLERERDFHQSVLDNEPQFKRGIAHGMALLDMQNDPSYREAIRIRGNAERKVRALNTSIAALKRALEAALASPRATEDVPQNKVRDAAYSVAVGASARLLDAVNKACAMIELGDQRLLASDGPAGGQPPDITLKEWRTLYVTLDNARKGK